MPRFDDPRYITVKALPPAGCVPTDVGGLFGLHCRRPGETLLAAVAEVGAEVKSAHDILLTDLGLEKLWEHMDDDRNGHGGAIVAQLLLMATYRAGLVGYSTEDLVGFLKAIGHA